MDLNDALKWLNESVNRRSGHSLREPDIVILKGTWRGLTYEQMANGSDYSTNYLMRDVAPKLWKQLSNVFGRSVGKTNFRVALEAYAAANTKHSVGNRTENKTGSIDSFERPNNRTAGNGDFLTALLTSYQGYSPEETEPTSNRSFDSLSSSSLSSPNSDNRSHSGNSSGNSSGNNSIGSHPAVIPDSASSFSSAAGVSAYGERLRHQRSPVGDFADQSAVSANNRSASNTIYSGLSIHAMSAATLYGYDDQFAQACQWIGEAITHPDERASASESSAGLFYPKEHQPMGQLIGIWGLHGVGKTLIAEKLVSSMGDRFDAVVWRSLATSPTLDELSISILSGLGITVGEGRPVTQLLALMEQSPLLIVLEDIEAILRPNALAGDYQANYQNYTEFFRAATGARSCILITGLEGPADFVRQGSYGRRQNVRSLTLPRLSESAATALLEAEFRPSAWRSALSSTAISSTSTSSTSVEGGHEAANTDANQANQQGRAEVDSAEVDSAEVGSEADPLWRSHWPELIARYQGHPLALKAAVRVIKEIFNGRVDEFLQQSSVLFTDIVRLIAPSFKRLSRVEVNVIYWLASQEVPLSLTELQATMPISMSTMSAVSTGEPIPDPISVLDSLIQRSLLEINTESASSTFYLPALVKAYAVHQFIGRFHEASDPSCQGVNAQALVPAGGITSSGIEGIIDLSPPSHSSVHLSQWFQGRFEPSWHSLERLFKNSGRPAVGRAIRWTYHFQNETFVKRYKLVELLAQSKADSETQSKAQLEANSELLRPSSPCQNSHHPIVLVMAVCPDDQDTYRICAQAQPNQNASVLPQNLELRLLDKQQQVLAIVAAGQDDSFIQLPYFRGAATEPFAIEIVLGGCHHTETFVV